MITVEDIHNKVDELILKYPGEFYEGEHFLDEIEHYFTGLEDAGEISEGLIEPDFSSVKFKVLMNDGTVLTAERLIDGGKV